MKNNKIIIITLLIVIVLIIGVVFALLKDKGYNVKILVPAHSSDVFVYANEEISPKKNEITITAGKGLNDCEVVLKTVYVNEENAYEPTYLTHGMPVKMDAQKGAWFKIGVNMSNPTSEDIVVYLNIKNVDVRVE